MPSVDSIGSHSGSTNKKLCFARFNFVLGFTMSYKILLELNSFIRKSNFCDYEQ